MRNDQSYNSDFQLFWTIMTLGMNIKGIVASSVSLGILLHQGIGDTIRVSLTPAPNQRICAPPTRYIPYVKPRDVDKREGEIYTDISRIYPRYNAPHEPQTCIATNPRTPDNLVHKLGLQILKLFGRTFISKTVSLKGQKGSGILTYPHPGTGWRCKHRATRQD